MAAIALAALIAAAGLGAGAMQIRAASVAASPFPARDTPAGVQGWVVAVEPNERGPRLRLLVRTIEGVAEPPRYVRVSVPAVGVLTPGRAALCRAVLGPPSGPMARGAYDFARRAYFERLGASGFALGRCRPIALPAPPSSMDRMRLALNALRHDLSAAIQSAAPGRGGAIAAALVSGDRSAIDQQTNETLQNSGLGHLLSVSGVHMGVVGGLVFASLLAGLSLIAPIALRWPVKKIAAFGALAALGVYLIVSGSSVPALRAFVMAAVAFGAILIDRPAISMRGLGLAAILVVALFPESVLEPGFQMSFAATLALVALFESLKRSPSEPDLPAPGPLIGSMQWIARGIGGVIGVSLVAGLATDPFAIYHFQRFATYALAANLAAAPIMTFLVAPAAGVAAVLAPFGLADAPLQVMASALDLVAAIGEVFGARPEAVRALPKPPDVAFLLCVAALLWASLWRGGVRWGGLGLLVLAGALYVGAPRPILAFDQDLRAVFAKTGDASSWSLMARPGRSTYARERLGAMLGLTPRQIEHLPPPHTCTDLLCGWRTPRGHRVFVVTEAAGFDAACVSGALVLSARPAPDDFVRSCGARLIDPLSLSQSGGGFVREDGEGLHISRVREPGQLRPWTPRAAAQE